MTVNRHLVFGVTYFISLSSVFVNSLVRKDGQTSECGDVLPSESYNVVAFVSCANYKPSDLLFLAPSLRMTEALHFTLTRVNVKASFFLGASMKDTQSSVYCLIILSCLPAF